MTNLDDFDRSLGAFLRDGPSTAPEAPVIAALAHARTTPRRHDAFAALRPDAMAKPREWLGTRPALFLGVVVLLAAAVGIAVVGSRPQQTVPPVTITPSPRASTAPSESPAPAESASTFGAVVSLVVRQGQPVDASVTDTTGDLRRAESVDPGNDGASVDGVRIDRDPADPAAMTVRWVGSCERAVSIAVDEPSRTITIFPERCTGDTLPLDRVLRLTFAGPIDPELWSGRVDAAGEARPTPTLAPAGSDVHLGDSEGRPVTAEVHDQTGHLTGMTVVPADRVGLVEFIEVRNIDPMTILITWPGAVCDSVNRIVVAADFGIRVERPTCTREFDTATWAIRLDFDVPVAADTLDTALVSAPRGRDFPAFVTTATDAAGQPWRMDVFDESGTLVNAAGVTGVVPVDPGADGVRLEQVGAAVVRVVWRDASCATTPSLRIDPIGKAWTLERATCASLQPDVLRVLDVKLRNPLSVDAIKITLAPPPA